MSQGAMSARMRAELEWAVVVAVAGPLAQVFTAVQPGQLVGQQPVIGFQGEICAKFALHAAEQVVDAFLAKHPDFRLHSPIVASN
jgi:hypothetical protein